MVYCLEIIVVEHICVLYVPVQVVHACQQDFASALCRSQDEGSVVFVLPFADGEKHLREILASEIHTCYLIISLYTQVFYQMS